MTHQHIGALSPFRRAARPLAIDVDLRHFALITYRVPASRVLPLLPPQLELETHRSSGQELAFISTGCFLNHDFRPALTESPRLSFHQITYRTYVRCKGHSGIYFFGTQLSTFGSYLLERLVCRDARRARFEVESDPTTLRVLALGRTHESLSFEIETQDWPEAREPFASGTELVDFLTYRLHGFLHGPRGILLDLAVSHPRMNPRSCRLIDADFRVWKALGLLSEREMLEPYSVLLQPEVPFEAYPPIPVAWLRGSHEDRLLKQAA